MSGLSSPKNRASRFGDRRVDIWANTSFAFDRLPFDLQELSLRYLSARDLFSCARTSPAWRAVYHGAVQSLYVEITGEPLREMRIQTQLHWLHRMHHMHAADHALLLLLWSAKQNAPRLISKILRIHRGLVNSQTSAARVKAKDLEPGAKAERGGLGTALHLAARARNVRCVDNLLRHKASASVKNGKVRRQHRRHVIWWRRVVARLGCGCE
jgi:hypothetical protein